MERGAKEFAERNRFKIFKRPFAYGDNHLYEVVGYVDDKYDNYVSVLRDDGAGSLVLGTEKLFREGIKRTDVLHIGEMKLAVWEAPEPEAAPKQTVLRLENRKRDFEELREQRVRIVKTGSVEKLHERFVGKTGVVVSYTHGGNTTLILKMDDGNGFSWHKHRSLCVPIDDVEPAYFGLYDGAVIELLGARRQLIGTPDTGEHPGVRLVSRTLTEQYTV